MCAGDEVYMSASDEFSLKVSLVSFASTLNTRSLSVRSLYRGVNVDYLTFLNSSILLDANLCVSVSE